MGFEYHIKFQKPVGFILAEFLRNIDNPRDSSGWNAFTVEEIEDGIYFCDHCRSDTASIAFRKLVDSALLENNSVNIESL